MSPDASSVTPYILSNRTYRVPAINNFKSIYINKNDQRFLLFPLGEGRQCVNAAAIKESNSFVAGCSELFI